MERSFSINIPGSAAPRGAAAAWEKPAYGRWSFAIFLWCVFADVLLIQLFVDGGEARHREGGIIALGKAARVHAWPRRDGVGFVPSSPPGEHRLPPAGPIGLAPLIWTLALLILPCVAMAVRQRLDACALGLGAAAQLECMRMDAQPSVRPLPAAAIDPCPPPLHAPHPSCS